VAELTNTERRANGSYRELQRIKQLETELERLIVAVDQRLKTAPANAGEETADAPPTMLAWLRQGLTPKRGLAVLAGGSALLLLGWFGASRYYETRLAYAVQAELRPFTMDLPRSGPFGVTRALNPMARRIAAVISSMSSGESDSRRSLINSWA
jgi:hypothetical protein